jgi:putative addiction module antidote
MITADVTSLGNSVVVILPPEAVDRLRVASGDKVQLIETPTGVELQRVDAELGAQLAAFEQVMGEDDEALRRLAE